ncbi:MAG: ArgK/MeaB family GTPase, partial [Acidimicrobiia bacterium]
AILGDRVRMQDHATDPGVFIRSMATRGHLGGLSLATPQAVRVLDAAGKPWVLIETVGVGQVEIEVAGAADTTVVVVNPGWGDSVQASKAGLLEIADLFVVNKADRDGADETVRDLDFMLELSLQPGARGVPGAAAWKPPIVKTVASKGDGIDELWDAIGAHRRFLESDGRLAVRRAERVREELHSIVVGRLYEQAGAVCAGPRFEEAAEAVLSRRVDPYTAAEGLLAGD